MAGTDAIVIGAGLAGLACALALSDRGLRVTVLEASDTPGGRARSWTDATTGDRVDIGPHILLSEYRNLRAMLERLGTHEQIAWQGRRFLLLADQPQLEIRVDPLPAPLHLLPSLLKAPQAPMHDLVSNARVLWRTLRLTADDVQALDAIDAETLVRRLGVTPHFIDWFWRTGAMTLMNVPLGECSAGALLQLFRFLIGVSGYEVGLAKVGLGDLFAPAAIRAIEANGGKVRFGAPVAGLIGDASATGVRLRDGAELHAPRCIAAVPPDALRAMLPPHWTGRHGLFDSFARFKPSPYISSYLWFDRKLTREPFWSKVWTPRTLHYDFYDLSNIRSGWRDRASVIACNLIHSDRAAGLSDDQIVQAAVREAAEFVPGAADAHVTHASVHRIPMAIPSPHPGTERLRPGPITPVEGLFLAGDWLDTGLPSSMESAVRGGWLAAEAVLSTAGGRAEAIARPVPTLQGLAALIGHRSLR
ncbi:hydroxysqualene dehydroxylase HpnE [Lysobacter korlensis]|uniref:Hydroxysqualene dehydroxylase HpnE n=1 Tax=Lysobacter korlensis TaxID=553636 RepID=A0ABV6RJ65_9GAMM